MQHSLIGLVQVFELSVDWYTARMLNKIIIMILMATLFTKGIHSLWLIAVINDHDN